MFLQLYIPLSSIWIIVSSPLIFNLAATSIAVTARNSVDWLDTKPEEQFEQCQNMLWPGGQQTVSCLVHQSQSKSKGHILKKLQISCSTYRNFTPFMLTSPSPGPASDSGSCCTSAGIPDNKALLVNNFHTCSQLWPPRYHAWTSTWKSEQWNSKKFADGE